MITFTREPSGVDHRAALVDAAPQRRHDAVDHVHHVGAVAELEIAQHQHAVALDKDLVRPVYQDLGDRLVAQQRLDGAIAQHLGHNLLEQGVAVDARQRDGLFGQRLVENALENRPHVRG